MSVFLSRLRLNLHRREVQQDLADCQAMHRRVLSAFPQAPAGSARDHFGVLYRVEAQQDQVTVIVQSTTVPQWERLPSVYTLAMPETKSIEALLTRLAVGMPLRFRLVANPTRRINSGNPNETEQWRGKRVAIFGATHQLDWLARKGQVGGFALVPTHQTTVSDVRVMPQALANGRRMDNARVTLGMVRFDGRLRITDVEQFRQTLLTGIGSGKAFGMGLLSIAPDAPRF